MIHEMRKKERKKMIYYLVKFSENIKLFSICKFPFKKIVFVRPNLTTIIDLSNVKIRNP